MAVSIDGLQVEATEVSDDDRLMIAQGGVTKKVSPALLGGGVPPFGTLAFEWNGLDTSQFESAPAFFDSTSGSAGSLSVVSTPMGPALRFTSGGGSGFQQVILAVDPLPFNGESRDHLIEVVGGEAAPTSSSTRAGIATLCDDSAANFHGFILAASVNGNCMMGTINNGVMESNTLGLAASKLTRYQFVSSKKPAGAPPIVTSLLDGYGVSTDITGYIRRTGETVSDRGGVSGQLGDSSVLGATWNALDCNRWGIGILTQTGGSPPTSWDILSLRVFI